MQLNNYWDIENKHQINTYTLSKDDLLFTSHPRVALQEAVKNVNCHPVVFIDSGIITTFFVLQYNNTPYSSNENALILKSFSTDSRHQRKGYAKAALRQLNQYVKNNYDSINEVVLAVNSKNAPAIQLYSECGFADTNTRILTDRGTLCILALSIV